MKTARDRRKVFRGPIGFTPAESKVAAAMAVVIVIASGVVVYQRSVHPVPRVVSDVQAIPAGWGAQPSAETSATAADTVTRSTPLIAETRIDLNAADYVDLLRLPGIGPVLASRIIEYRDHHGPFRLVDSLVAVPGIGIKKLDVLRPLIFVQ